jgi:GNAT superfamily N-acetyltransferase
MSDTANVRAATFDDLPAAAAHYLGMRRELQWDEGVLADDFHERFIMRHLTGMASGEMQYFVAECDGRLVGSALAIVRTSPSDAFLQRGPSGYLANVYVDKAWRRKGIARSLTIAAIAWLRGRRCIRVRLAASAAGRPLYASLGFVDANEMVLDFEPP